MLDPRIYRAAFLPVLLAILVVAFSLESRPRPIGTTLAPDAFDGASAARTLDAWARDFPARRPGGLDDERLAARVAQDLGVLGRGAVTTTRTRAQTVDGEQELTTVVATRPGQPGPGLVVVAHRDALGVPARAELSGTVALVELARVAAAGRLQRTVTFVSTSGGTGGLAGARAAAARIPRPADAVLVLGDLASTAVTKPLVVDWSNGGGAAPLRLRRTLEAALRAETGQEAGGPRARSQWSRNALPMTVGEQGAFGAAGLGAVLLSASGERPPAADAPTSPRRLAAYGRTALRTVLALDAGPDLPRGPQEALVTQRKVLPSWAVALGVGALLAPVWFATLDGLARTRRRRLPLGAGLRWVLAGALPFVLTATFALLLGLVGLLPARPGAPVPAGAIPLDGAAAGVLATLALVFVLGWLLLRPLALRATGSTPAEVPPGDGHGAAALTIVGVVSLVAWIVNPYAAALLILPAHLWLLAVAPEAHLPRPVALGLAALALLPVVGVLVSLAGQLGYGPGEFAWALVLMVAGGHIGPLTWLGWGTIGGTAISVALLVTRHRAEPAQGTGPVTVRGPRSYAGPGSLGGTDSALRR